MQKCNVNTEGVPIFLLVGPPGSSKTNLSLKLSRGAGLVHVSTGDLLREQMTDLESSLGKRIRIYSEQGLFVPDEIVTQLLYKRLSREDVLRSGALIVGFPRTLDQAKALCRDVDNFTVIVLTAEKHQILEHLDGNPPPQFEIRWALYQKDTVRDAIAYLGTFNPVVEIPFDELAYLSTSSILKSLNIKAA